jgi:type I restriction enzyme S subunit
MRIEKVRISDVCEVTGGTTPSTRVPDYWDGDITWLSPVDLPAVGTIVEVNDSQRKITAKALAETSLRMLPVGAVVYSTRASIGKIGHVVQPLVTNQGFTNMIPGPRINNRYLAYALKYFTPQIELLGNSTTFNEVSRTAIKNFELPLPSLEVQQRIADTLDTADALRRKDQELLQKYDELAQSIFYEMFGDPGKNEKGWPEKKLRELCSNITDGTHFSPPMVDAGYPYVTAKHLKEWGLDFYRDPTYVDAEHHRAIYNRCNPVKGDVLYIKDGATTGIAAVNEYGFEFSMLSSLALIKPQPDLLSNYYLVSWLNHPSVKEKYLREFMAGAAIKRFTLQKIKSFGVLVPPIELQVEYANKIAQITRLKSACTNALGHSQGLFNSLMSTTFAG